MKWIKALICLPILASCSERQICLSDATRDLRQVRAFVAEAKGNLDRGYGYKEESIVSYDIEKCGEKENGDAIFCRVPEVDTVRKPVAIDLDAEAAKLKALVTKEAELSKKAAAALAVCEQKYPKE